MEDKGRIIVVGAGAAGLMAAMAAGQLTAPVLLVEKNLVPGKKLALTGNGRCNLTHMADPAGIIKGLPGNGKFLYKALQRFGPNDLMELMNSLKVPTKVEEDGRVFPVSDKAQDVIGALRTASDRWHVGFRLGETVKSLDIQDGDCKGVYLESGEKVVAHAVIVATGGASYPGTGSTGDGYRLAKEAGHSLVPIRPSLVPLISHDDYLPKLQGVSLQAVRIRAYQGDKVLAEERGDMLFTHYGLSGPAILRLSRLVVPALAGQERLSVAVNIAGTDEAGCDAKVRQAIEEGNKKAAKNMLESLLPHKMVGVFLELLGMDPQKPAHQVTKEERRGIVRLMTDLRVPIDGHRPLAEATVTAGGVSTKEINPQTMESRLVSGLYFAGEVVDVDGYTGGYNLQAAFSMGYVAGEAAAKRWNSL
jgi:predicted Rossmann fold flavoprotein